MADDSRDEIERLFRDSGPGVGRYVLARVGDRELAEEITARVFLAVVRGYAQLRGPAAAWLWAIVRNEISRHYRCAGSGAIRPVGTGGLRPPLAEFEDGNAPPAEEAVRAETQRRLQSALAELADEQQQILYMKFFQDMRNLDIAGALGLTPTNVGVLVHRALRALREHMEPHHAEPQYGEPRAGRPTAAARAPGE